MISSYLLSQVKKANYNYGFFYRRKLRRYSRFDWNIEIRTLIIDRSLNIFTFEGRYQHYKFQICWIKLVQIVLFQFCLETVLRKTL